MKLLKNIISAMLCLSVCVPVTTVRAESNDILVYKAWITNGTESDRGLASVEFSERVKLDFNKGRVELKTPVTQPAEGENAYCLVPDGEQFLYEYTVDAETGMTTVCINGETAVSAICDSNKGIRNINSYWTEYKTNPTSTKNSLVVSDEEFITPGANSVQLLDCDTAGVSVRTVNAINYSELVKFDIYDASGNSIGLADSKKSIYDLRFDAARELTVGQEYTLCASDIYDIYGKRTDINISFTPQKEARIVSGADVEVSAEQRKSMGFERRIDWFTNARLTHDNGFMAEETAMGRDDIKEYYGGLHAMELSKEHAVQGKYSLKWDRHNYYETIATYNLPSDWTGSNMFGIDIYSERATGETVNMIIYSDNPATPWQDGYTYPITVDWQGGRHFDIKLSDFYIFEDPAGFNNVSALYFSAKMFGAQPHPQTVIFLDNITITYDPAFDITPHPQIRREPEYAHRGQRYTEQYLNHNDEELELNPKTPYEYQAYNKAERALYGYFPKYSPGMISFDPSGKAYIRPDGTHIQYLDDSGKWKVVDLEPYMRGLITGADTRIWDSGGYEENVIRFDNDGWAYALVTTARYSFLCYSSDGMQNWEVLNVTKYVGESLYKWVRFEHIVGNNTEALDRPPLIIAHDGVNTHGAYIVVLSKTEDGKLGFSDKKKYSDRCIQIANHTGDGNCLVTKNGKAYIVYSDMYYDKSALPQDNYAFGMSYIRNGETLYYKNGVPAFVRMYDLATGELSEPVFVGMGGVELDDHNWAGIDVDSNGYLHIILNGHHDPVAYTRSVDPQDISAWSMPELIGEYNSYGALMIDRKNNAYIMTRDASRGYRFDTSVVRKNVSRSSGRWTKSYIVQRKTPYYEIARQKMTYDPSDDSIYVFYYAISTYSEMFADDYDSVRFMIPDAERYMCNVCIDGKYGVRPAGTCYTAEEERVKHSYEIDDTNGRDGVLVRSTDGGRTFTLVKTSDLK